MRKKIILFALIIFTSFITGCKKDKKQIVLANEETLIKESEEGSTITKEKETETQIEIQKEKETKKQRKESVKLDVKNIQQLPEYRSGCEITSTTIVLNYLGYDISKTELANYLPITDFYSENGVYYSGNPNIEFCGTLEDGYGCYAGAIRKTLLNYFSEIKERRKVVNLSGSDPEVLYNNVSEGRPVIVWITISMVEPAEGTHWIIKDTGKEFVWTKHEHCVVLIGYTKDTVILSDPYDYRGEVEYSKELFEERYRQMFSQAIVIK